MEMIKNFLPLLAEIADLDRGFIQVQVAGEHNNSHLGVKMIRTSEADRMNYANHIKLSKPGTGKYMPIEGRCQ